MNEFQQQYASARNAADNIKVQADKIMGVFDEVDRNMKILYGDTWQSAGSETAEGRYSQLRKSYEIFYQEVIRMHNYIHTASKRYEESDTTVANIISEV